ncbi:hypothetical protein E1B28_011669 [Marasmius oreades]|uniref:Uncharacterized protein n=1 Tax=Marasmius oreades TaxID=181124 RepID=A0A9P7UQG5_9AGAR|nr:uncharacterized protein E1B28_011669 [Marasmius oreades]KAG7090050.1 hypothetical protein E1B28_011669 [Marasmius oreades]
MDLYRDPMDDMSMNGSADMDLCSFFGNITTPSLTNLSIGRYNPTIIEYNDEYTPRGIEWAPFILDHATAKALHEFLARSGPPSLTSLALTGIHFEDPGDLFDILTAQSPTLLRLSLVMCNSKSGSRAELWEDFFRLMASPVTTDSEFLGNLDELEFEYYSLRGVRDNHDPLYEMVKSRCRVADPSTKKLSRLRIFCHDGGYYPPIYHRVIKRLEEFSEDMLQLEVTERDFDKVPLGPVYMNTTWRHTTPPTIHYLPM